MMRRVLILIIGALIAISCSSLTPFQKHQLRQSKIEARIARAKADTLSIQRYDNTPFFWGGGLFRDSWFYNGYNGYRPQIIIPIRINRKRHGNIHNNNIRRGNHRNRSRGNIRSPKRIPKVLPGRRSVLPKRKIIKKQ